MTYPVAFGVALHSLLPMEMLPRMQATGRLLSFTCSRASRLPVPEAEPENTYPAQGRMMQVHVLQHGLRVLLVGLMQFELSLVADSIHCIATETATDDLVRYWFLGQILPMFLLFNGSTELLHATAVDTPQGAVAFIGASGVGKSTLLHHCLQQGGSLITDEHLALDRSDYTRAVPSLPLYRPYRSIEDLGVPAERFSPRPVELRSLYLLRPSDPQAPVSTEPLGSAALIASLLNNRQYNVFNPRLSQFFPLVQKRFAGLASLTRNIPIRRLHVPRALDRLPDVYRFLQQDLTQHRMARSA